MRVVINLVSLSKSFFKIPPKQVVIYWAIPAKSPNKGGGIGDMDFSGVNYKRSGISKDDQEKIMWNFQGSLFLALEFPKDLTQIRAISRG